MGSDPRSLDAIIRRDAADLRKLKLSRSQVSDRMDSITRRALEGLGTTVPVAPGLTASVNDTRGWLDCPWPHAVRCRKTVTTLCRPETGQTVRWSGLSAHLIREHGFFQGRGSAFRLDPAELADILFSF